MKQLASAIIKVMQAVAGIEKNLTVGTGQNSYKGVADKDVKKAIGDAMAANGLCILPVGIKPNMQIDRFETTDYNGKPTVKQNVITEVITEYLLLHESGESQIIYGYGHGTDSQDKSAGKATTYALKYALLYTFLVPTGKIDDADNIHSDSYQASAPKPAVKKAAPAPQKTELKTDNPKINQVVESVKSGKYTIEALRTWYIISPEVEKFINDNI